MVVSFGIPESQALPLQEEQEGREEELGSCVLFLFWCSWVSGLTHC